MTSFSNKVELSPEAKSAASSAKRRVFKLEAEKTWIELRKYTKPWLYLQADKTFSRYSYKLNAYENSRNKSFILTANKQWHRACFKNWFWLLLFFNIYLYNLLFTISKRLTYDKNLSFINLLMTGRALKLRHDQRIC